MLLTEGYDPAPVNLSEFKDVFYPITPTKFYIEYQKNDGLQNVSPFKNYGGHFFGIYSAWCNKKLSPLLQPFARHFGRSQNCKCRGTCVMVYPERPAEDCWGERQVFFFSRGRGDGGTKTTQQEIHRLKRSWQSSLNFDMSVFS